MNNSNLSSNYDCSSDYFQAICNLVARGNEARRNNGNSPLTTVSCHKDNLGEFLAIEHIILLDMEQEPLKLKLELRLNEIDGYAVYSGPTGYALKLTDVEILQQQLIALSRLGHDLKIAYNWYFGVDPNAEQSLEDLKKLVVGTEGDLFMTSRDELTTPNNFATRFMNSLGNLEPAYNEVLEALYTNE